MFPEKTDKSDNYAGQMMKTLKGITTIYSSRRRRRRRHHYHHHLRFNGRFRRYNLG